MELRQKDCFPQKSHSSGTMKKFVVLSLLGLLLGVTACSYSSTTKPADSTTHVDTSTHKDTTAHGLPFDTTTYRDGTVTIHGVSLIMQVNGMDTEIHMEIPVKGSGTWSRGASGPSLGYCRWSTPDSFDFGTNQFLCFRINRNTNTFTYVKYVSVDGYFNAGSGSTDSTCCVLTNVPYTVSANGALSAHIPISIASNHILSYYDSSTSSFKGNTTTTITKLRSVSAVTSDGYIDIKVNP